MNNLVVATRSAFREYLFEGNLDKNDLIVYERKKDFCVNYETKFLEQYIYEFTTQNFQSGPSQWQYFDIENINSIKFLDLIIEIGKIKRIIMTGANFLRKTQYLEVSKLVKTRLNIHMGDPHLFRGLDSNLWAMLANKKNHPVVTLHHANLNLDSGDIVFQKKSEKPFEEMTLQEFIRFEIEASKICLQKAIEIKEETLVESEFKNEGVYKSAMQTSDKKLAFKNLKSL